MGNEGASSGPRPRGAVPATVVLAACAILAGLYLLRGLLVGGAGLRADYGFVDAGGRRESVAQQIDPSVWLPRPAAFYPPYLRAWDAGRFGFPSRRPRLDVEWTGFLDVRQPGRRTIAVATSGDVQLEIGPLRVDASGAAKTAGIDLGRGRHPVRIHFRDSGADPALQVSEVLPDGRSVPLAGSLEPDEASADRRGRGLWLAVLVVLLAGSGSAWLGRGAPVPWFAVAAFGLLALALMLRLHDRAAVPSYAESADEYYHAWVGRSLLHGAAPVGWSWAPAYGTPRKTAFFGEEYPLVTPFLDHPPLSPLLSVLVGSAVAHYSGRPALAGYPPFDAPPLEALRVWPILASVLTLALLLLLGRRLFGGEAALAAGLLYATTPLWVAQQRFVKEESGLAPLLLAALLLVLEAPGAGRPLGALARRKWLLLAGLAALCPLLKSTALVVTVAVGGIALAQLLPALGGNSGERQAAKRDAAESAAARSILLALAAGTAAGLLLLGLYAAALDWGLYGRVQSWLAAKPSGFSTPLGVLTQATVAHLRPAGPGWTLWFWAAALPALSLRERRLAWVVLLYLLFIVTFVNPKLVFGWYLLPVQPLLALGAAALLLPPPRGRGEADDEGDRRLAACGLILFCLLYVGASLTILETSAATKPPARLFFVLSAAGLGAFLLPGLPSRVRRTAVWAALAVGAGINIHLSLHLRHIY